MATLHIDDESLTVRIRGLDAFYAFTRRITVPLAHVRGATADPGMVAEPKGRRGPGTHVPGHVIAGRFRHDGEDVFWDVRDRSKAVVIELDGERYDRLVVEFDDPRDAVAAIERATV